MIIATILSFVILSILAVFQIALALGAPIGRFAWGGQHRILPRKLRIGSAVSPLIYALFAAFALSKSGLWVLIQNETVVAIGLWIITAYFMIGIVMNGISRSKYERITITPLCVILSVCYLIITLG